MPAVQSKFAPQKYFRGFPPISEVSLHRWRYTARRASYLSMTATMAKEQELTAASDTLAALEQRVVRAVELLNREREQRSVIEKQIEGLREELQAQQSQTSALRKQLEELNHERDTVRTRVERLMASLDAIEAS